MKNNISVYLIFLILSLMFSYSLSKSKGTRYIKISQTKRSSYIVLKQLLVFRSNGDEVAHRKAVTQSSYYSDMYASSYLVDGMGDNMIFTGYSSKSWVLVDLKTIYTDIYKIILNVQNGYQSYLTNAQLELLDEDKKVLESFNLSSSTTFTFNTKYAKEFDKNSKKCDLYHFIKSIKVSCDNRNYKDALQLNEIQVFNTDDQNISIWRARAASSIQQGADYYLVDGNTNNYVATKSTLAPWFKIFLNEPTNNIKSVKVYSRNNLYGCNLFFIDEFGNALERVSLTPAKTVYDISPKCQDLNFKKNKRLRRSSLRLKK